MAKAKPSLDIIKQAVLDEFNIAAEGLKVVRRSKLNSDARFTAVLLAREFDYTNHEIKAAWGYATPKSVSQVANKAYNKYMGWTQDKTFSRRANRVKRAIYAMLRQSKDQDSPVSDIP